MKIEALCKLFDSKIFPKFPWCFRKLMSWAQDTRLIRVECWMRNGQKILFEHFVIFNVYFMAFPAYTQWPSTLNSHTQFQKYQQYMIQERIILRRKGQQRAEEWIKNPFVWHTQKPPPSPENSPLATSSMNVEWVCCELWTTHTRSSEVFNTFLTFACFLRRPSTTIERKKGRRGLELELLSYYSGTEHGTFINVFCADPNILVLVVSIPNKASNEY